MSDRVRIIEYKGKGRFANPQSVKIPDGARFCGITQKIGLLVSLGANGVYHFKDGQKHVWNSIDAEDFENVDTHTHEIEIGSTMKPEDRIELICNAPVAALSVKNRDEKMKIYFCTENRDEKTKQKFPYELNETSDAMGANGHFLNLAFHDSNQVLCVRSDRNEDGSAYFGKFDPTYMSRKRGKRKIPKGDYLKPICDLTDRRLSHPIQTELFMMKSKLGERYADVYAGILTERGFVLLRIRYSTDRHRKPTCNIREIPALAEACALASNNFCLAALIVRGAAVPSESLPPTAELGEES
ncbi:MAG: hypothetical protein SGARI_002469 [Bacillariaceae sp.]